MVPSESRSTETGHEYDGRSIYIRSFFGRFIQSNKDFGAAHQICQQEYSSQLSGISDYLVHGSILNKDMDESLRAYYSTLHVATSLAMSRRRI